MKYFIKILLFVLFSITTTFASAENKNYSKTIYVSSSNGNDTNDGSIEKPLKTFKNIPRENAKILLKRGDVFFEALTNLNNCHIDAYGEGAKPLICGFKILKNKNAWQNEGDNIWKLDLNNNADFYGYTTPIAEQDKDIHNNIGAIYDATTNTLHGRILKEKSSLKDNWDIHTSSIFGRKNINDQTYRYAYVKNKNNPSENSVLCFSTYGNGIKSVNNSTIKNLAIQGFGRHGIAIGANNIIENIDIDIIGGSIQVEYKTWVRLGNGIEFWVSDGFSPNNNHISGCTISRTYDCGTTIQGIGKKLSDVKNIKFLNNNFYHCRQAFEHFLTSKESPADYVDCEFSNNKSFEMGYNEFSSPEPRDMNILSYEGSNKSIKIHNNTCYGAGIYFGVYWSNNIANNTFYIFDDGRNLAASYNPSKVSAIPATSQEDIQAYRKRYNDNTSKIEFISKEDKSLRNKLIEKHFQYVKDLENRKSVFAK